MRFAFVCGIGLAAGLAAGSALAAPTSLQDALIEAYNTNPTLLEERANLRATDEGVPQALAGWRPTVTVSAQGGYDRGNIITSAPTVDGGDSSATIYRKPLTETFEVTENLFDGGATRASVHKAKNAVYAERAKLIATEEQVFAQVVTDYVTVIEDQQLLDLNKNNEQVLAEQLKATKDRFRVGELTQTDVAQARAAHEGAVAEVATAAGNLAAANAAYQHDIGSPPGDLVPPAPLAIKTTSKDEVTAIAARNNATVIEAQFTLAANHDAVDEAFAALLPQVNAELLGQRTQGVDDTVLDGLELERTKTNDGEALLSVEVPLYQGGAEYSKVRQAKQEVQESEQALIDAREAAISSAVQSLETLKAYSAAVTSDRSEVAADQIALSGVEREALVGTATTLDVLIEEEDLLQARTTLVQSLAQQVASSYGLAEALGNLTARDLRLDVPLYDETAYYDSVDTKLWGVSVPGPNGKPQ